VLDYTSVCFGKIVSFLQLTQ